MGVLQKDRIESAKGIAASIAYGLGTGFLAGLVGLGGAEERIPFILYYLRLPLDEMINANLLISLGTSSFNLAVRIQSGVWSTDAALVSVAMIAGSLPGAFAGATLSHSVSGRALKGFIALILAVVILKVVYGLLFAGGGQGLSFPSAVEVALAAVTGFGIGIISGGVGVAGGEYRIPVLAYLLGLPIKVAGTASQIVSVPTLLVAIWTQWRLRSFSRRTLRTALILGIPSLVGAIVSGLFIGAIEGTYIEILFVILLGYTVVRLLFEVAQGANKDDRNDPRKPRPV